VYSIKPFSYGVVAKFVDDVVESDAAQNAVSAEDEKTETVVERIVVQNNVIQNVVNMEVVDDVVGKNCSYGK
jgi:hypothetical protein